MEIIKKSERVSVISYSLEFEWNDCPGAGIGFDCDKDGNITFNKMNQAARENLNACICGEYNVRFTGVRKSEHRYMEPAVGTCNVCEEEVYLEGFTNTCGRCGTDYNQSGQQLASRSQWGEETGEHPADIAQIR